MSKVHVKTQIDAPIERVWETIMNPDRLGEWVTIHRRVKDASDSQKQGSTMEQVLHMRGVSFNVHWTLVEVNAPTLAVWEGRGPAHSKARIRYELSSQDDAGPTDFDYTNEFSPPGGALGRVASRVIVGAASEREATNSLHRLKALLERN
jgi:uncharacterized protein YndB with AHSA1/START domain